MTVQVVSAPLLAVRASGITPIQTTAPTLAWSTRRLRAAYSGPCLRAERSNGTQQDIGFTAGGDLDVAALETFAAGGQVRVRTWYNQGSGGAGGNATQTTWFNQPLLTDETGKVIRTGPALRPGIGRWLGPLTLADGTLVAFPAGATVSTVADIGRALSNEIVFVGYRGHYWTVGAIANRRLALRWTDSGYYDDQATFWQQTVNAAPAESDEVTSGQCYRWTWRWKPDGTMRRRLSGQERSFDAGRPWATQPDTGTGMIGSNQAIFTPWLGRIAELIIWPGDLDAATQAETEASQVTWFGVA